MLFDVTSPIFCPSRSADGSFTVSNLSPGSYVVDVTNPRYQFEPVRVDINSKGKLRARRVNHIVPSEVRYLLGDGDGSCGVEWVGAVDLRAVGGGVISGPARNESVFHWEAW